jgi:hypothetical protein
MSNNLMNELEQFKSTYYSDNKKCAVFKAAQKHDLASKICSQFGQDELFAKAVYQIRDTNKVYINYPVFKMFVNPSNYEAFVSFNQSIFNECIRQHGTFECHVNLEGLTISAVERHQRLVELFCTDPEQRDGMEYTNYLIKVCIYNTPSVIDNIINLLKKLLDPDILKRLVKYTKGETPYQMSLL